uniref:hypothetical protein n=1 Tax=Paractinoplanes polyasparticus TaxID=2856853 RepID=UPI001C864DC1|nr:hypothetical protein [Actinoplanes polyasparticus]
MSMDPGDVRGLMNQLLYPIDGAPDLSDAMAARMVDNLIDGRLFAHPPAVYAEAMDHTLSRGALHPETAEMSRRFTEPDLVDFLRRVRQLLEERRPWPPPKFRKIDVAEWPSFGDAAVIAQVNRPTLQLTGAVGFPFDHIPAGEGKLPVLILQLRTGEVIALMGSVDPRSTTFALLLRGSDDATAAITHFQQLSGLRPTDITALSK